MLFGNWVDQVDYRGDSEECHTSVHKIDPGNSGLDVDPYQVSDSSLGKIKNSDSDVKG